MSARQLKNQELKKKQQGEDQQYLNGLRQLLLSKVDNFTEKEEVYIKKHLQPLLPSKYRSNKSPDLIRESNDSDQRLNNKINKYILETYFFNKLFECLHCQKEDIRGLEEKIAGLNLSLKIYPSCIQKLLDDCNTYDISDDKIKLLEIIKDDYFGDINGCITKQISADDLIKVIDAMKNVVKNVRMERIDTKKIRQKIAILVSDAKESFKKIQETKSPVFEIFDNIILSNLEKIIRGYTYLFKNGRTNALELLQKEVMGIFDDNLIDYKFTNSGMSESIFGLVNTEIIKPLKAKDVHIYNIDLVAQKALDVFKGKAIKLLKKY